MPHRRYPQDRRHLVRLATPHLQSPHHPPYLAESPVSSRRCSSYSKSSPDPRTHHPSLPCVCEPPDLQLHSPIRRSASQPPSPPTQQTRGQRSYSSRPPYETVV